MLSNGSGGMNDGTANVSVKNQWGQNQLEHGKKADTKHLDPIHLGISIDAKQIDANAPCDLALLVKIMSDTRMDANNVHKSTHSLRDIR